MHSIASIEEPDGQTTTLSYASNGLDLTGVSSAAGTVRMVYDSKHNPIETTDINGVKTAISYNEFGQISSQTDELGQVTEYHYDADHRLQRVSKAGVTLKSLTYDEKDRVLTETDHTGLTLRFEHNDLDTLTKVTYPDQRSITYNYPSCPGVLESSVNRVGHLSNYRYNGRKELVSILAPDQTAQKFSYDKNSQIIEFTDENQNPTRYEYDKVGRLTKEIQADGRNRQFIYGANGLIAREISARGIETIYTYDIQDQLIRVQYSDGTPTETFSYDSLGRVVSISDGSGLYQLAYNRDSSLQSVDGPWAGDTVSYFYDAKGRLVRSRYEGGQDVFYTYDDLDRLSRILHGSKSFEYSYSAQNLLEKVSLANGMSSDYQWDMLQRVSRLTNRGSNASLLTQHEFSYNDGDLISEEKSLNTLVPSKKSSLKTFTHNQLNQMLSDSSQPGSFEYDADGNLTKGFTLSGRPFTASYDALNRMKEITTTDEQGVAHRKEYHYSSSGLVSRELYYQNGQLKDDIRFIHDGFLPVQDRNAQNQVLREYTWGMSKGGGVEGLLSLRQAAKDYYYVYDGKGNVTAVYDQEQKAVAQYAYDAFGELLAQSGSLVQPFRFSTKRYDELFGFYDYGYRRYSPLMHRWLTRDPIGLDGGTNLYGFVGNNPVNMIDPEGHCAVAGAIGGAAFDIGSQLFENNGKFSCINWGSVASSAAIGGLTCGVVGKLVQLKELGKLGQLMRKGTKGLGTNPFKGKTAQEIEKMLLEKGYTPKGPNPLTGHGTYVNPKSGRAFHIDALHPPPKPPHVGVYRPRSARDLDISSVREYPLN